jgi:hypothetical protein
MRQTPLPNRPMKKPVGREPMKALKGKEKKREVVWVGALSVSTGFVFQDF